MAQRAQRSGGAAVSPPVAQNQAPVVTDSPASGHSIAADTPEQGLSGGDESPEQASGPQMRATRIPFGTTEEKLKLPDVPGFRTYWFNDTPGRIDRAKAAGYEHRLDANRQPISRVVGVSTGGQGGLRAYAMMIPMEFFNEDQAAELAKVDAVHGQIVNGKLETKDGDNRYVPKDRPIRITQGR